MPSAFDILLKHSARNVANMNAVKDFDIREYSLYQEAKCQTQFYLERV
jgi:hypothetical protein